MHQEHKHCRAAEIVPAVQPAKVADLHDKLDSAGWVTQLADVSDVSLLDGVQCSQGILQDGQRHCQLTLALLLDGTRHISLLIHNAYLVNVTCHVLRVTAATVPSTCAAAAQYSILTCQV